MRQNNGASPVRERDIAWSADGLAEEARICELVSQTGSSLSFVKFLGETQCYLAPEASFASITPTTHAPIHLVVNELLDR